MISNASVQQQNGFGVASPIQNGETPLAPPGLLSEFPAPPTISIVQMGMLMKTIQQYVQEFPKLGLGEPGARDTRLITWKINVAQLAKFCCHVDQPLINGGHGV